MKMNLLLSSLLAKLGLSSHSGLLSRMNHLARCGVHHSSLVLSLTFVSCANPSKSVENDVGDGRQLHKESSIKRRETQGKFKHDSDKTSGKRMSRADDSDLTHHRIQYSEPEENGSNHHVSNPAKDSNQINSEDGTTPQRQHGGRPSGARPSSKKVMNAKSGRCQTDEDCHTQANYCGGCECVALHSGQLLTKCKQAQVVECLADPCAGARAKCRNEVCVVLVPGMIEE